MEHAENSPTSPLAFQCSCGTLRGTLSQEAARAGTRLACFCADCRAAQLYLGQPDPAQNGVQLLQTSPEAITLTAGHDQLRLLRLSPKGLMRWYAGCCNSPVANTLASPRLPFVGIQVANFDTPAVFGKTRVQAFMPQPAGKPPRTKGAIGMVISMFRRMGASLLSGKWRDTPFFDCTTGDPVCQAKIPSKEELKR